MGSFKDKTDRFLVIDHSEDYSFFACRSGEEVDSLIKSRELKPDNFWILNLADCVIFQERLSFVQDHQFENLAKRANKGST